MQSTVSGEVLLITQGHEGKIAFIMVFGSMCYSDFLQESSAKSNFCHYPSAHETSFSLSDVWISDVQKKYEIPVIMAYKREKTHHLIVCTNPIWNTRYNSEGQNRVCFGCTIAAEQLQHKRIIISSPSNEDLDKILLVLKSFKLYQKQDWAKQTIITSLPHRVSSDLL